MIIPKHDGPTQQDRLIAYIAKSKNKQVTPEEASKSLGFSKSEISLIACYLRRRNFITIKKKGWHHYKYVLTSNFPQVVKRIVQEVEDAEARSY